MHTIHERHSAKYSRLAHPVVVIVPLNAEKWLVQRGWLYAR
jgi:hypothetical protein